MENSPLRLAEGPTGSGKTQWLIQNACDFLAPPQANPSSHPSINPSSNSDQLLILTSNRARQLAFRNALTNKLADTGSNIQGGALGGLMIYTFSGWVRTQLQNYWPLVEEAIARQMGSGEASIRPLQLAGYEQTELWLNELWQWGCQQHPELAPVIKGSARMYVSQLVRRARLRSENNLTRSEFYHRDGLLENPLQTMVKEIEQTCDRWSYVLRALDPNKQLDMFSWLLKHSEIFQKACGFPAIQAVLVDDVDETHPAQQAYVEWLLPQVDFLAMAADPEGGSRRGYLNAYPAGWQVLKSKNPQVPVLQLPPITEHGNLDNANRLLRNWQSAYGPFECMSPDGVRVHNSQLTRVEMFEAVANRIEEDATHSPEQIVLVLPKADRLSKTALSLCLNRRRIPHFWLTGTLRPVDDPLCRGFVSLIQIRYSALWQWPLSRMEWHHVFHVALNIPQFRGDKVSDALHLLIEKLVQGVISPLELDSSELWREINLSDTAAQARLTHLAGWLKDMGESDDTTFTFEDLLYRAFHDVVRVYATDETLFESVERVIQNYQSYCTVQRARRKWVQGVASSVQGNLWEHSLTQDSQDAKRWLEQLKQGTVADTPAEMPDIPQGVVVIATPQKLIDLEMTRPVQYWLDATSREWARSDDAALYNSWVFSPNWDGKTVQLGEAQAQALIRERAGHVCRQLMLLATESVEVFTSDLDDYGFSQHGPLLSRMLPVQEALDIPTEESLLKQLREDQKSVLDYQSGTMAITAVPGAGKTYVNVVLVQALVARGIPPDAILLLTYMDAAAKTLLTRLKTRLNWTKGKLPVVSTLHSLAFRVLMEHDHAVKLGYDPDEMKIMDDFESDTLLNEVVSHTLIEGEHENTWRKLVAAGIKHAKTLELMPDKLEQALSQLKVQENKLYPKLRRFLNAYHLYENRKQQAGLWDFNDLILKAIQLLEQEASILVYYQAQFQVIIEDEAQDSSLLMQRFIGLLGGNTPNLIRTGDTNQSITTTFNAADPQVFRDFIASSQHQVVMRQSARSAPEIITLANQWLDTITGTPGLENTFSPVAMQPVTTVSGEIQNPTLIEPIVTTLYNTYEDEITDLVQTVQRLRRHYPDKQVAVLTFTNEQVLDLARRFQASGLMAVSLTDKADSQPVYQVLFHYLSWLESPGQCERQLAFFDAYQKTRDGAQTVPANFTEDIPEETPHKRALRQREYLASTVLIHQRPDWIEDATLLQWFFDLADDTRLVSDRNMTQVIVRATNRLFETPEARSQGYLFALQIEEIQRQLKEVVTLMPLEALIERLSWLMSKGFRHNSFNSDDSLKNPDVIQVMTLHKSKGQEFDFVLIPFLQKKEFKSKDPDKLVYWLDGLAARVDTALGPINELIEDPMAVAKQEERARLIYVGITRARQGLFISAHEKKIPPSVAFTELKRLTESLNIAKEGVHAN
ncbi:MAG: ATP-dependent helicase [Cyanobacteria bacterium]|nr:ATP-dependent helicase [Cyanobacteriota bacterium]